MWPKWLRALIGAWVALDSRERTGISYLWISICVLLGPLILPFYLTMRPLLPGEKRKGGFFWNLFWNFEILFSTLLSLAAMATTVENFVESEQGDKALVKRAEIKAGTILGFVVSIAMFFCCRFVAKTIKVVLED